jgi:hypothetical protein
MAFSSSDSVLSAAASDATSSAVSPFSVICSRFSTLASMR